MKIVLQVFENTIALSTLTTGRNGVCVASLIILLHAARAPTIRQRSGCVLRRAGDTTEQALPEAHEIDWRVSIGDQHRLKAKGLQEFHLRVRARRSDRLNGVRADRFDLQFELVRFDARHFALLVDLQFVLLAGELDLGFARELQTGEFGFRFDAGRFGFQTRCKEEQSEWFGEFR